jgi:hypothetical protein
MVLRPFSSPFNAFYKIPVDLKILLSVEESIQFNDIGKILDGILRLFAHDLNAYHIVDNIPQIVGLFDPPVPQDAPRERAELFVGKEQKAFGEVLTGHMTLFPEQGQIKLKAVHDEQIGLEFVPGITADLDNFTLDLIRNQV